MSLAMVCVWGSSHVIESLDFARLSILAFSSSMSSGEIRKTSLDALLAGGSLGPAWDEAAAGVRGLAGIIGK